MAEIAVFASGRGSNFLALAERLKGTNHRICCLICDNPRAPVLKYSEAYGVPSHRISYSSVSRTEAEDSIVSVLDCYKPALLVLAGYMRVLSADFVCRFRNRIVNIHPSLLPKYPGINGISESYNSKDSELGITIHYVDSGVDTGPIIFQASFHRTGMESSDEIEERIHALEHIHYPDIVLGLLEDKETTH